jgi:hypothetical protein
MFVTMVVIGMLFNPMNMLAYRVDDFYISLTLFYGGLLMASNMIWSHEIVHYLSMGMFDKKSFFIGIVLSIAVVGILRSQLYVSDEQWLKRMISHHSTALTTSYKIQKNTKNEKLKELAQNIIDTQEYEIKLMKSML